MTRFRRFRRSTNVLLTAAALCGGAWLFLRDVRLTPGVFSASLEAPQPLRLHWEKGTAYRYRITLTSTTKVDLASAGIPAASGIDTKVDVDGEIELRCLGPGEEGTLFEASFPHWEKHLLSMLGKDALAGAAGEALLMGSNAFVAIDERGAVRRVWTRRDASALFSTMAEYLLEHFEIALPEGAASSPWIASEDSPAGRATASYARDGADGFVRRRSHYDDIRALPEELVARASQRVNGEARGKVHHDGYLERLEEDEELTATLPSAPSPNVAATSKLVLTSLGTRSFGDTSPFDPTTMVARTPGARAAANVDMRDLLEKNLIGNFTLEALTHGVDIAAIGGRVELEPGLVARSAAFLRVHPEAVDALVAKFGEGTATGASRAFILDLLASAGSPKAQEGMRAALASRAAHDDPHLYVKLVQRFAFVEVPVRASATFLGDAYFAARGSERYATAHALGSTAGRLARSHDAEDRALASKYTRELTRDARDAKEPGERRELLAALGNVGSKEAHEALAANAGDANDGVRSAVAMGLRNAVAGDAREALFRLVADPSEGVGATALAALGYQTLTPADMKALAAIITAGTTNSASDGALLTLLSQHATKGDPAARAMAELVLARCGDDARLAQRAQQVLDRIGGS